MPEKTDYKKQQKNLYIPGKKPYIVEVPKMTFIMIDGSGNPNTSETYQAALETLYGLSFTIKMSKMNGSQPDGYFEYVVPPLEGLWWTYGIAFDGINVTDKDSFCWTSMIRQPEFVTREVFERAKDTLSKKKPNLNLSAARLEVFEEGLCAQIMHIGPYDDEPATIVKLEQFISEQGYTLDINEERKHHEIYLSDPRRTAAEKLRTVIRHPICKK